jgi:hypothetical protein
MKKILISTFISVSLAGCSDATRTLPVLVVEERPIGSIVYQERPPLVVPPDYRNPKLPPPKEDMVLKEWKKNNFR